MSRSALDIAKARAAAAEANRARFPFATRIVDELRTEFSDARVTFAREPDGQTVGKCGPQGEVRA